MKQGRDRIGVEVRRFAARAACVLLCLGPAATVIWAQPARKPAVAVLKIEAVGGVAPSLTASLDKYLSSEVFGTSRYEMVNRDKMDAVMKEFKIQKSGLCDSTKCYAELGGAMGAEKLVAPSLSRVGKTYLFNLTLIGIQEIREEFNETVRCACEEDVLLDKISELVGRMTGNGPKTSTSPVFPASSPPAAPLTKAPPTLRGAPVGATHLSAADLRFTWPRMGDFAGADGAPMVLVQAGEFLMGSASSDSQAQNDERPQHLVVLKAFYIDKFEVTNGQYLAFMKAVERNGHAFCDRGEPSGKDHTPAMATWNRAEWNDSRQPVVNVDWYDATAYCAWAGKRLPTEAEWEKAARGTDGRNYPWGNDRPGAFPQGNFADESAKRKNPGWKMVEGYDDGYVSTAPVGSFHRGASPFGAEDLAGNVWEWVRDWYGQNYYQNSPREDPIGASSGQYCVLRGGSWLRDPGLLRSASRGRAEPTSRNSRFGFRCAQDQ